MEYKLYDSELKLLEILWDSGELPARDVAAQAADAVGWSKTTTYTVLKKCVEKGLVERTEPGFLCRPVITREEAQRRETLGLIDRMYGGSAGWWRLCWTVRPSPATRSSGCASWWRS